MKVLYQNKVGKLVTSNTGLYCNDCIYHHKDTSVSQFKKVGLMRLCVGLLMIINLY